MKKLISLVLALALSTTMLASCAKTETTTTSTTASGDSTAATTEAADSESSNTWEGQGLAHPLQDVRVRQALTYAIDMDTIIEGLFEGKATAAQALSSPGDWLASGLETYSYDPDMATALLAEAGWPADYTLDVVYYYDDQQTVDLMTVIGQYWSEVGVKAQFRKLEGDLSAQLWTPASDTVNGPSSVAWDIAYGAIAALTEDEFYSRFSSTASNNSTLPYYEGLDEMLAAITSTADVSEQIAATQAVQVVMNEEVMQIPLYHQVAFIFTGDKLDLAGNDVGNDQYSYDKGILDWTIDRADNTLMTNMGPVEFFEAPLVNPGLYPYQELMFDKLINADGGLNPTDGMLAETYSYNEDQTVLTFEMRDGLTWHDGDDLTAEDVKFSFELYAKAPTTAVNVNNALTPLKGFAEYLDGTADHIEGIVVDGNTVIFEMEDISPTMLTVLSQWPILPSHLLTLGDALTLQQNQFWQAPVGSGPFKYSEFVAGNYAVLERWDGYYETGTGNIEKIKMTSSTENDGNLIKNMEAGDIDYAWSKSTDDALAAEKIATMTTHVAEIRYTRLFYINQYPHDANIK